MAQYGVFSDPSGNGYLLDVQSDLLDGLNVRAVVPFLPQGNALIAAFPASVLKAPVWDLSERFDEVTAALDMVLHGF